MLRRASTVSEKMIKVDHVGENGAVSIYRAQLMVAKFRAPALVPDIKHFISHELAHRDIFKNYLANHEIRRCISYWFGGFGGYILGLVTGVLGPQAITATTFAIESVVLSHLDEQLEHLKTHDKNAYACVLKIYADEQEHLNMATAKLAQNNAFTPLLIRIVKFSTETVIRFGMR